MLQNSTTDVNCVEDLNHTWENSEFVDVVLESTQD